MQSPIMSPAAGGHSRNQSVNDMKLPMLSRADSRRLQNGSNRNSTPAGTFAPQFIKSEDLDGAAERVRGIEGENDFSGKRYVWLKDSDAAFLRGWVVEELPIDIV